MKKALIYAGVVAFGLGFAVVASSQFSNPGASGGGGTFTGGSLASDLDLAGNDIGAVSSLTSNAANPADTGVVRLGNTESVCWENATPGTDYCWTLSAGNSLTANTQVSTSQFLAVGGFSISSGPSLETGGTAKKLKIQDAYTGEVDSVCIDFTSKKYNLYEGNCSTYAGVIGQYYASDDANPADTGQLRLGQFNSVCWESSGGTDRCISNDDDQLAFADGINVAATPANGGSEGRINLANTEKICWELATPGTPENCQAVTAQNVLSYTGTAGTNLPTDAEAKFGTSSNAQIGFETGFNPDAFGIYTPLLSNAVVISEVADIGQPVSLNSGVVYTNPTLVFLGANPNNSATVSMDNTNPNNLLLDTFNTGGVYIPDYLTFNTDPNMATMNPNDIIRLSQVQKACWEAQPAGNNQCLAMNDSEVMLFENFTGLRLIDNQYFLFGTTDTDARLRTVSATNPDSFFISPGTDSGIVGFANQDDLSNVVNNTALVGSPPFDDVHVRAYSSNFVTDPNEYIEFWHDQTKGNIAVRQGSLSISPSRQTITKGGSIEITQAQTIITCDNSLTYTATNLVPAGAVLLGVYARTLTTTDGAATLGDGTDPDLFGELVDNDAGDTSTGATAQWSIPTLAAVSPVLTYADPCTQGTVAITASYISITPPTTN